ncbi:MAG: hypothetical protein WCP93_04165 [Candidatus Berkelbacteria bacterium]
MQIYETENFIVESHEKPEIDRLEGGHIKISPKVKVEDRTKLTPKQAIELMRLTMISGEAMVRAMAKIGVEIGRINYQDNGNWNPELHIHLYCRAKNAVMQKYGDPIIPGNRPEYKPLNESDVAEIKKQISEVEKQEKYKIENW